MYENIDGLKTVSEAIFCKITGLSRMTAWRLRNSGRLSHYRIGNRVFYSQRHIEEFLEANEEKATRLVRNGRTFKPSGRG